MSEIALVLAGHGSHISPHTAGLVWAYVDRLRSWGVAEEITACFWKEPPSFRRVFDTLLARHIVVVPVFTARGYFTQEVIPSEMGLTGAITIKDGRRIRLTRALGEHPLLDTIVQTLVTECLRTHDLKTDDTAVALIGHGTRRNPQSRDATRRQAESLRALGLAREVVDVYLDDVPDIPSLYRSTTAANILALPYFLAPGSHVSIDVPRALGIQGNALPERVNGRRIFYVEPVGIDDRICQVILELARETGLPFAPSERVDAWGAFPLAGRETLLRAVQNGDSLRFGQVNVSGERVWHGEESSDCLALASPAQLRKTLRESPFRPLPTTADLPAGWQVELGKAEDAHAALETIYPGLVADWAAARQGRLHTESLEETAGRQLGMFRDIHLLGEAAIETTLEQVCGNCIRQPTWWDTNLDGGLPCGAACNYWLSSAVKSGEATV